jgi:RimJ/RimL family protein N-acetyltransferase
MPVTIRPIRMEDARAYLDLACALDSETSFMMMEPGERTTSVEEQSKRIATVLSSGNSLIFVAENEASELVGLLGAIGGSARRSRETVHIFVGVRQAFAGQGIGRHGALGAGLGRSPPGTDCDGA